MKISAKSVLLGAFGGFTAPVTLTKWLNLLLMVIRGFRCGVLAGLGAVVLAGVLVIIDYAMLARVWATRGDVRAPITGLSTVTLGADQPDHLREYRPPTSAQSVVGSLSPSGSSRAWPRAAVRHQPDRRCGRTPVPVSLCGDNALVVVRFAVILAALIG